MHVCVGARAAVWRYVWRCVCVCVCVCVWAAVSSRQICVDMICAACFTVCGSVAVCFICECTCVCVCARGCVEVCVCVCVCVQTADMCGLDV